MTTHKPSITVFGEVLFDCFPNGKQVLGGAPFNVAWHLQALGDNPIFISRIGDDALGETIIKSAQAWELSTDNIQLDQAHPTGRVDITVYDNEPHYDITPGSAYDFISAQSVQLTKRSGLLYHGSLALRSLMPNSNSKPCANPAIGRCFWTSTSVRPGGIKPACSTGFSPRAGSNSMSTNCVNSAFRNLCWKWRCVISKPSSNWSRSLSPAARKAPPSSPPKVSSARHRARFPNLSIPSRRRRLYGGFHSWSNRILAYSRHLDRSTGVCESSHRVTRRHTRPQGLLQYLLETNA